jgi:hypothetical protein
VEVEELRPFEVEAARNRLQDEELHQEEVGRIYLLREAEEA